MIMIWTPLGVFRTRNFNMCRQHSTQGYKSWLLERKIPDAILWARIQVRDLHPANSLLQGIPRKRCATIAIYTSSRNVFPTLSWPQPDNTTKGNLGVPVSARPRRTIENDTRCQKRGVSGRTDR